LELIDTVTNPETDPLPAVEAYLSAVGGSWALIPSSLRVSIWHHQPADDPDYSDATLTVVRAERQKAYERAVRAFAQQYLALTLHRDAGIAPR
jgi:hypothetical protein